MTTFDPVPCAHIALFYQLRWEGHKCIAFNLLRKAYLEWATGSVKYPENNNLFGPYSI